MSLRSLTKLILLVLLAALIAYDVGAVLLGGVEATISRVILRASRDWPVLTFASGALCGHLFFPQVIEREDETCR